MPEVIDEVTTINEILRSLGSDPIFSLTEGTPKAQKAVPAFRRTVRELLERNTAGWTFARKTYKLDRDAATPVNGYRTGFLLPGDRVGNPIKVLDNPRSTEPLRDFSIEAGLIYADRDELWTLHVVETAPDVWSPTFYSLVVAAVGSRLAIPIGHDATLAEDLRVQAFGPVQMQGRGGLFATALNSDIAGAGAVAPTTARDPLTGAWYG